MTSFVAAIRNRWDNRLLGDAYNYITEMLLSSCEWFMCLRGSNRSPVSDGRPVLLTDGAFAVDESAWCLSACRRLHAQLATTAQDWIQLRMNPSSSPSTVPQLTRICTLPAWLLTTRSIFAWTPLEPSRFDPGNLAVPNHLVPGFLSLVNLLAERVVERPRVL